MKKSAFAAIIGRPSAGKSTLLNRMCGGKVAIVSSVPQTTRNAIRGIVNKPEGQLVFIDTPGRHSSEKKMNKRLMEVSARALQESDLVLYVLDASRAPGPEEEEIAALLSALAEKTIAAVNKIDLNSADFDRAASFLSQRLFQPSLPARVCEAPLKTGENRRFSPEETPTIFSAHSFSCGHCFSCADRGRVFPVSAVNGSGIDDLLGALFEMAPEGQPLYGDEYYTDQETGFRIAEIIREQAINRLRQELPHSLYVEIADMEFKNETGQDKKTDLWVRAFIMVERESQKGMVVGKGGEMIKAIRLSALKELNQIFDWKIDLDLRVKTGKDWRHNDHTLKKIIN